MVQRRDFISLVTNLKFNYAAVVDANGNYEDEILIDKDYQIH